VYTRALAENDGDSRQQIEDEINKQQKRKDNYKNLEKQLKESGEAQISISDPESRQIMLRNNITEVAYNVQSTVDSKNNIPIDYKVTNQNDSKAMGIWYEGLRAYSALMNLLYYTIKISYRFRT